MTNRNALARDDSGAALVEFSLVLVPLLIVVLGFMELGYQSYVRSVLQGSLNDVARVASVENPSLGDSSLPLETRIQNRVKARMSPLVRTGTYDFDISNYKDFASVGRPEALVTDVNAKVYVGALYLPSKQTNAAAILAADAPRRQVMHFLYDVDKGKMAEAWQEGLADNTPNASAEVKTAFKTLSTWMADMKEGQSIVLTYVPGIGTTVDVAGKSKGTLGGKAVSDAILNTWIGPKPGPGADFKKGVLGQ
jgi:hypothetical protein